MFEAYITNTALYPLMGIEVGTTVHFPMTTQELQAALAKIGIDGKRYSEVFFTSFDSDVLGLYDYLYECENIDELNELGHALLEVRDKGGLETFEAALVLGNHTRSVKDLINLTQNLDLYRFYPDISDDEGLGRLYADELGTIKKAVSWALREIGKTDFEYAEKVLLTAYDLLASGNKVQIWIAKDVIKELETAVKVKERKRLITSNSKMGRER